MLRLTSTIILRVIFTRWKGRKFEYKHGTINFFTIYYFSPYNNPYLKGKFALDKNKATYALAHPSHITLQNSTHSNYGSSAKWEKL